MTGDPGLEVVARVRAAIEPEAAWLSLEPRGFAWWPHRFAVRVWAEPPRPDGAARAHVETPLVAGVAGTGAHFGALARRNASDPGFSTLRWNGETGVVSLRAAVIARAGDEDEAARRLAHAALLQAGDALRQGDALAAELAGEPCVSAPAGAAGARAAPDALAEAWRAYAERGAAPAYDAGALERLAALEPRPWLRANLGGHGLDAELPCAAPGGPAPASAPGAGVALLRMTLAQPHPRLGQGLLAALRPPADAEPVAGRAAATAALLNEGEAREWTGVDQLGGWCVHPAQGLVYVSFTPALACDDDALPRTAWQMAQRARWMRAFLARVATLREAAREA